MTIFYCAALKSIDDVIDAIDEITDNEKFDELRIVLFSKVVNAVHQISDYPFYSYITILQRLL